MAIAFDKAGNGQGSTSASVSLAAAAADEVAIMFVIYNKVSGSTTLGNVTVNGSTTGVTQMGSEFQATGDDVWYMRAYYFNNPSTSSVAYAAAASGTEPAVKIITLMYSGASTTQPDSQGDDTAATNTVTMSTTVVASNCWLVSAAVQRGESGAPSAGTGTTSRTNNGTDWAGGDSNTTVGTGAQTMQWNGTASATHVGGIIISLAPVAASGPANLKSYNTNLKANIKSINTNLIANVKSLNTNV